VLRALCKRTLLYVFLPNDTDLVTMLILNINSPSILEGSWEVGEREEPPSTFNILLMEIHHAPGTTPRGSHTPVHQAKFLTSSFSFLGIETENQEPEMFQVLEVTLVLPLQHSSYTLPMQSPGSARTMCAPFLVMECPLLWQCSVTSSLRSS
jgi:hypothetical protein